jgi:hypothetical protein
MGHWETSIVVALFAASLAAPAWAQTPGTTSGGQAAQTSSGPVSSYDTMGMPETLTPSAWGTPSAAAVTPGATGGDTTSAPAPALVSGGAATGGASACAGSPLCVSFTAAFGAEATSSAPDDCLP